jgi:hypothetical protein
MSVSGGFEQDYCAARLGAGHSSDAEDPELVLHINEIRTSHKLDLIKVLPSCIAWQLDAGPPEPRRSGRKTLSQLCADLKCSSLARKGL